MGLDMYLKQLIIEDGITTIHEAIYWGKANAIHNWFTKEIGSKDINLIGFAISYEQLLKLKEACLEVLNDHSKAEELLPTMEGFFFSTTDYNERYFNGLERTVNEIDKLDKDGSYVYYSSW